MHGLTIRRLFATVTTSGLVLLSLAAPAIAQETTPTPSPSATVSTETPSEPSVEPTTASEPPTTDAATPAANPPAPSPAATPQAAKVVPADFSGNTYTVVTDELCNPDGSFVVRSGGALTIDFERLRDPSATSVVFASDAAKSCLTGLTSLTINPRRYGTTVTSLEVGIDAFAQITGENSLTSVSFPAGLKTLTIWDRAFVQIASQANQSNALTTVNLPSSLTTLTIGSEAFRQESVGDGAHNALASIAFPSGLETLTIGEGAFEQDTAGDGIANSLANVSFPAGLTTLSIASSAFEQSTNGVNANNGLTSIGFPDSLTSLTLGDSAFAQEAAGVGSRTTLTSIDFPDGSASLTIGVATFGQSGAATSLTSVTFPASLRTLAIDEGAFGQESGHVTTLTSVTFPEGLETLTIGPAAFAQVAIDSTTLASVTFPDGLTRLDITENAFIQASTRSALKSVSFPRSLGRLTVGSRAFTPYCDTIFAQSVGTHPLGAAAVSPASRDPQICGPIQVIFRSTARMSGTDALLIETDAVPAGSTWAWFGPDQTPLARAWINSYATLPEATLSGYHTLTFDADGGTFTTTRLHPATALANTWFVYPDGSHASQPAVTTAGPLATTDWTTTLPSASRSGYTFTGWCETANCANPRPAGTRFAVTGDTQTLSAVWTINQVPNPPVFTTPSALSDGKSGQAYRLEVTFSGTSATSCTLASGTLPTGLTLSNCVISGTPTASGTFQFTIAGTNADGTTTKAFEIAITAATSTTGDTDDPATNSDDDLAYTGADPAPLGLAAAMLLAVGLGLTFASRRRAR
jgi:uncharacterized repeat protein (TIGR02543 family)